MAHYKKENKPKEWMSELELGQFVVNMSRLSLDMFVIDGFLKHFQVYKKGKYILQKNLGLKDITNFFFKK